MSINQQNLSIAALQQAYLDKTITPESLINQLSEQAKSLSATWIYLLSADELAPYLANLKDKSPATHPLYGVPALFVRFLVKAPNSICSRSAVHLP